MKSLQGNQILNRRSFLAKSAAGLGAAALTALIPAQSGASPSRLPFIPHPGRRNARAKRVIYLFQSGAPSQLDTFDYKPGLRDLFGTELPESIRKGQRLTTMTSGQKSFPIAPSVFDFHQHGESGAWVCDLFPHTAGIVDRLCIVRSMWTEAINHDPAITFCQTGSQLAGRPSMGAWVAYGLGTMNRDLPTFVVLVSSTLSKQPLYDRLWGSGFLPAHFQGVKLRNGRDPVLHLSTPDGCSSDQRRAMLDELRILNQKHHQSAGDPEILARIEQYELAFRMQTSVPELTDMSDEPAAVLDLYGEDVHVPGSFARNCLLARRLAERDVRFIQLYHMGWDHHGDLPNSMKALAKATDQPASALVQDLEQRGLLEDTLVVWGGEFGRTVYSQGQLSKENHGRDHHPRCYSVWMAGGGVRPGLVYGQTDDFSYNIVADPVEVHDLNATILHQLGLDHEKLVYPFQGRDFRLTDVHGRVVKELLA
ncbi:MAG: DUF1501 domain-containing protein [Planctomycetota bacterium]|nr:MAG: DUF1501 domain-containing protein [Planctomycetota bacterium]